MCLMLIIPLALSQHSINKLDFTYENKNGKARNGKLYYSVQYLAKGPSSSATLLDNINASDNTLYFSFNESNQLKKGIIEIGINGFGIPSRMSDYVFIIDPMKCFNKAEGLAILSGDVRMELEPMNNVSQKIIKVVEFKASDNVSGKFKLKFGVFHKEKPTSEWTFDSNEIEFNYVISGLTPCIEPETQWNQVDQSDLQAVCAFIDNYKKDKCPDVNENAQSVYDALDDEVFAGVVSKANQTSRRSEKIEVYRQYVNLFQNCKSLPNQSTNIQEAQRVIKTLEESKEVPEPKKEDPDKKLWRASEALNTLKAYQDYLKTFPDGKYADMAKDKILCLKPIVVTTNELNANGVKTVEILLENVNKPRYKNTSIDDGLIIDDSKLLEEHKLVVTFNTDGRFQIMIKDACLKDTLISFDNTLTAFWKFNQDSTALNFNIKNGRKPYRIDFLHTETDEVITVTDSLMVNTFTLTRELMNELRLNGTYEPNVKDADSWRPRTLPTVSIERQKQPALKLIATIFGSIVLVALLLYFIRRWMKLRKQSQQVVIDN